MPNLAGFSNQDLIAELESRLGDARRGLPLEVFELASRLMPLTNVDLLIQDDAGRTLYTWRDDEFFGAGWHLPGGIIRYKERPETRVAACAQAELGAEVAFDPEPVTVLHNILPQLTTRGHFISFLYRCRLTSPLDEARRARSETPERDQWRWFDACPGNLVEVQDPYRPFLS